MGVTLEDLRKRLQEAEQEVEELKAAVRVMERLEGVKTQGPVNDLRRPRLAETGVINLDELDLPKKAKEQKITLGDEVRNVIERFGSQEFTVSHVEAALRQMGKGSDAKHFKNRVSINIRKLCAEGLLEKTHEGIGSDPHKYRRAPHVSLVRNGSNGE